MGKKRRQLPQEPVEARIESLTHEGRGLTHVDGKAVFVHGALAGERVLFRYTRAQRRYDEGLVTEVLEPAAERVQPRCPSFGICGGCSLQHMDPAAQIAAKQEILADVLRRIGKVEPERWLEPLAATLIAQAVLKCCKDGERPILHSDNGAPMKSFTMRAKLEALGIKPSYSRPRVSNDNPYIESMFRTVKYCPLWPSQGFVSLEEARGWVASFMRWYNEEHRHSALRYVTPGQRYRGEDKALLEKRFEVYQQAKALNPNRWSGSTRNWRPINDVALNPEKELSLAA